MPAPPPAHAPSSSRHLPAPPLRLLLDSLSFTACLPLTSPAGLQSLFSAHLLTAPLVLFSWVQFSSVHFGSVRLGSSQAMGINRTAGPMKKKRVEMEKLLEKKSKWQMGVSSTLGGVCFFRGKGSKCLPRVSCNCNSNCSHKCNFYRIWTAGGCS